MQGLRTAGWLLSILLLTLSVGTVEAQDGGEGGSLSLLAVEAKEDPFAASDPATVDGAVRQAHDAVMEHVETHRGMVSRLTRQVAASGLGDSIRFIHGRETTGAGGHLELLPGWAIQALNDRFAAEEERGRALWESGEALPSWYAGRQPAPRYEGDFSWAEALFGRRSDAGASAFPEPRSQGLWGREEVQGDPAAGQGLLARIAGLDALRERAEANLTGVANGDAQAVEVLNAYHDGVKASLEDTLSAAAGYRRSLPESGSFDDLMGTISPGTVDAVERRMAESFFNGARMAKQDSFRAKDPPTPDWARQFLEQEAAGGDRP